MHDVNIKKKEREKKMEYIISHSNKTNPIRFKEKFDFFYYHSLKIIDGDQRDNKDRLLDTIIQNSKLSETEKVEFKRRRTSLLDNDLNNILGLIKETKQKMNAKQKKSFLKRQSSYIVNNEFSKTKKFEIEDKKHKRYDYFGNYKLHRHEVKMLSYYSGNELVDYYKQKPNVLDS